MNDDFVTKELFDRVEKEGVSCTSVSDGYVFAFSADFLSRLLADAELSEKKQVILFVRKQPKEIA